MGDGGHKLLINPLFNGLRIGNQKEVQYIAAIIFLHPFSKSSESLCGFLLYATVIFQTPSPIEIQSREGTNIMLPNILTA